MQCALLGVDGAPEYPQQPQHAFATAMDIPVNGHICATLYLHSKTMAEFKQ